jgi:1-acyl-sn-glycerol-3-phosphate acyltransferase
MSGVPTELAPNVPRLPDTAFRRFCRWAIKRTGWRFVGEMPNEKKVVVIGAPHSSYWDGVYGLLMMQAIRLELGVMIKREAFDGPFGPILRWMRLIPIDRKAATNVVDQMVARFAASDKLWLGIAPEGTRKPVKQWKSGFLRIARAANVPIQPVFIDYPTKTFTLGPLVYTTDDPDADMARIRAMFVGYHGKHRDA